MCSRVVVVLGLVGLSATAKAATKVACVGDSITRGAGTTIGGYSTLLAKMLGSGWQVGKFGNSGSTMMKSPTDSYWVAPEFAAAKAFAPEVVVIMLGTNDAKGSWTSADGPHHFEPDYRAMVAEFAALPSKPRFVLVWPPPMIRPTLKTQDMILQTQVDPIISRIATDTGSRLAKVRDAFLPDPTRYFGAGDGVDIADGLHPNDSGAQRIADTVFCALVPSDAKCGGAPPRDAGVDVIARDARSDLGGDATEEDAHADAHADAHGITEADAEVTADARTEPDVAAGPKDTAVPTGGQGGHAAEPEPEPEPVTPAMTAAPGCHCELSTGRPSLFALALAVLALVSGRRRA
jgi:acyl-CoA thioesterase-1